MSPSMDATVSASTQETIIKPTVIRVSEDMTTSPPIAISELLMDEPNRESVTDTRLSICSTSGAVYESVMVVGHIYGSDNIVYYLLEVQSWGMPLEGYVIRRRYNDFKQLHRELAACMLPWNGAAITKKNPLGIYTSLLCHPLPSRAPSMRLPSREVSSYRRSSLTGLHIYEDEDSNVPHRNSQAHGRYSAPTLMIPTSTRPPSSQVSLPFETVAFHPNGRPMLPELPSGGLTSYFSTREVLIQQRMIQFNKILAAVLCDTSSDVAQILMKFIQDSPSIPTTYTSLAQYAPIEVPWSVERDARKRATSVGKKNTQQSVVAAIG